MSRRRAGTAAARHPSSSTPQFIFDYHRTIIGYHGTAKAIAANLVDGAPFDASTNDDDWLGHGIYFWEYAPQQAWSWARRRHGPEAAVVGAMIRLGRCLDLLDPENVKSVVAAHDDFSSALSVTGQRPPDNANVHKYLDCAVLNFLYDQTGRAGYNLESCRALFAPLEGGKFPRLWPRSGVLRNTHIQVCVRSPANILAVWSVRKDGRYGKDQ
jgi:hypothetical protein